MGEGEGEADGHGDRDGEGEGEGEGEEEGEREGAGEGQGGKQGEREGEGEGPLRAWTLRFNGRSEEDLRQWVRLNPPGCRHVWILLATPATEPKGTAAALRRRQRE